MRALFERTQAAKEKERREREQARLGQQDLQNRRNLESKKRRENEISELRVNVEKRKSENLVVNDEEYNIPLRRGKINSELDENIRRKKELELEMLEKVTKTDSKSEFIDGWSERNSEKLSSQGRRKREVDIFGEIEEAEGRSDASAWEDYPPKGQNVKAAGQKKGFLKNPIPFTERPTYSLLKSYANNLTAVFGCLTRSGFDRVFKSDPGKEKLYPDTEDLEEDGDEEASVLSIGTGNTAGVESNPGSSSAGKKTSRGSSVSELRAEFEKSRDRKDPGKQIKDRPGENIGSDKEMEKGKHQSDEGVSVNNPESDKALR
jgi:hypothetical protein